MKNLCSFILIIPLLFTSCYDEDYTLRWEDPDVLFFSKIWDERPHSAFTDIISYDNFHYCAFREGNGHVSTSENDYGKIRILKSSDGEHWSTAGILEDVNFDLRDPDMAITPSGELMVLYGKSSLNETGGKMSFKNTGVSFATNNTVGDLKFNISEDIILSRKWLWKVTWHKNIAYGIAYTNGLSPILFSSTNGINWKQICEFKEFGSSQCNEADIIFTDNDEMIVVLRSNISNGYYGMSPKPYNKWQWKALNHQIHCPELFYIDNELFVTGRGERGNNVLYYINKDIELKPLYLFPGGGDSGYPGVIRVKDELWISYYTTIDRSSIYLVKILSDKILEKTEIY